MKMMKRNVSLAKICWLAAFLMQAFAASQQNESTTMEIGSENATGAFNDSTFNQTDSSNNGSNATNNGTNTNNNNDSSDNEAFEFVAFLAWYLFLLLCCVVPACCAFGRRRAMDRSAAAQHAATQLQLRNHWFAWTQTQQAHSEANAIMRKQVLAESLQATSMIVTENDLMDLSAVDVDDTEAQHDVNENATTRLALKEQLAEEDGALATGNDTPPPVARTDLESGSNDPHLIDYDMNDCMEESNRLLLRLPIGRSVNSMCAICLSQYEPGERVTWFSHCPHVFHTECIIGWLSKKQHCPICRQEYTDVLPAMQHENEQQQRQLAMAFSGGSGSVPSLFTIGSDGRLEPLSYGGSSNASQRSSGIWQPRLTVTRQNEHVTHVVPSQSIFEINHADVRQA
ncbi:hypothetical protein MPSEU_000334600 [Mayamaea pseudoterrestris]|nr:hypothetical protein MPSEU_000334600 [Mayamaea pseudoterrestris]